MASDGADGADGANGAGGEIRPCGPPPPLMCFSSIAEATEVVKSHATANGYELLLHSRYPSNTENAIRYTFRCNRSRPYKSQSTAPVEKRRKRTSLMTNCPFSLAIKKQHDGYWYVLPTKQGHNHGAKPPPSSRRSRADDTSGRAVVWVGAKQLEIQQKPIKPPIDDEVLVKVVSTGICGSDVHNWESDAVSKQLVLGHESAGVVEKIGRNVQDRKVGQRVAIEPGSPCSKCEFCLRGCPNICANLKYCGLDPVDGTLCQYFTCRESMTVPIPDDVSWEEAGAIQPLAVAVHVARRAALSISQTVAIFGCGPLGLLILAVAKAHGVKKIVMFDIEESRVQFAQLYGADIGITTAAYTGPRGDSLAFAQQYAEQILADHGIGHGFDVAIEASGADICVQIGVAMLKPGGTLIQAGLGKPLTPSPLFLLTAKELTIKGTVRYTPGCFADAIDLLASKKVDLKPLITGVFPLTRAAEAFEAQYARQGIKIIIMNQQ